MKNSVVPQKCFVKQVGFVFFSAMGFKSEKIIFPKNIYNRLGNVEKCEKPGMWKPMNICNENIEKMLEELPRPILFLLNMKPKQTVKLNRNFFTTLEHIG